jgi:hypothetical protein
MAGDFRENRNPRCFINHVQRAVNNDNVETTTWLVVNISQTSVRRFNGS